MATPTPTRLRPPDGAPEPSPGPARAAAVLGVLRNAWRGLTAMRTALVLLFLLALAALPGALLPQRSLNVQLVDRYLADHPSLGPALDTLDAFDVFGAPWFAAVYLLLMISLVGCVLPRTVADVRALRAPLVATPRNLSRLPHHAEGTLDVDPAAALARVEVVLGRGPRAWRRARTVEAPTRDADNSDDVAAGEVVTVSAEKGHLREFGNLAFHLSLIGVLLGFAAGKLYGYDGQVVAFRHFSTSAFVISQNGFIAGSPSRSCSPDCSDSSSRSP